MVESFNNTKDAEVTRRLNYSNFFDLNECRPSAFYLRP